MRYIFVYRNIRYGGCEFLIEKLTRELKQVKPLDIEIICVCESVSKEMEEAMKRNNVKVSIINPWDDLQKYIEEQIGEINIIAFEGKDFINLFYAKGKYKKTILYAIHPRAITGCGDNDDVRKYFLDTSREFIGELGKKAHIVAMDEPVRTETARYYKEKQEIEILRICVDVSKKDTKRNLSDVLDNPMILTVARAEFPFKGYILGLIRWFGKYDFDNLKLEIVTFGACYDEIIAEIDKLEDSKRENIIISNKVPHEKLGELYKKATVYVGMGTSVLESVINKVPTIPIRPDTFELLCNGRFDENPGYVCGDDSLEWKDFSKCITEILMMDKEQYREVGIKGYNAACEIYDTKVIVNRLEEIMSRCSYDCKENSSSIIDMDNKRQIIKNSLEERAEFISGIKGRNVYIWGGGIGGKDVFCMLKRHGIEVKAFVDERFNEMGDLYGLSVVCKDVLDLSKDYVVISLKKYNVSIIEYLESQGFVREKDYIVFYDIILNRR